MMKNVKPSGRRCVAVDLLVPTRLRSQFKVDTDSPRKLSVSEAVPAFFHGKERLMAANADDGEFTEENNLLENGILLQRFLGS